MLWQHLERCRACDAALAGSVEHHALVRRVEEREEEAHGEGIDAALDELVEQLFDVSLG